MWHIAVYIRIYYINLIISKKNKSRNQRLMTGGIYCYFIIDAPLQVVLYNIVFLLVTHFIKIKPIM